MNRRSNRAAAASDSSPSPKYHHEQQQEDDFDKRFLKLETENLALKREIEELKCRGPNKSPLSANSVQKLKENGFQQLNVLEEQMMQLKKKLKVQSQLSMQRQRTGDSRRQHQDEIQRLKAQKVQLMCKSKLDSVQFRLSKALLEKELIQLRKEQRRNEYEMRKLLALNQRQKLVLQRKTEEASMAAKRLNELLESKKAYCGTKSDGGSQIQGIELELKFAARVEDIRSEYERQMEEMAEELRKFEEEAETLREENFRFLLQDKEVDCIVRDSELKDLKQEVARLSNLVNQLPVPKAQQVHMKKPQVDLFQSSISVDTSITSSGMGTSESEFSGGNISMTGKSTPGLCCSCSKKSLCKTQKCECRAAGGCCGARCGCTASKCANRKVLSINTGNSLQPKVAPGSGHGSSASETDKGIIFSGPTEPNNACGPRRKPLSETGNIPINPNPVKPRQKTRGKKKIIQLDTAENGEGPDEADEITHPDKPKKLTRSMRSAVSNE